MSIYLMEYLTVREVINSHEGCDSVTHVNIKTYEPSKSKPIASNAIPNAKRDR